MSNAKKSYALNQAHLINVDDLHFDPNNPRLVEADCTTSQVSLFNELCEQQDIGGIFDSMIQSGYFIEEPLIAVEEKIPGSTGKVLVIIEGNRRLAALKKIKKDPKVDKKSKTSLEKIPVVIKENRAAALSVIGFRHITGIKEWSSAAKANYAFRMINDGHSISDIAHAIGDKNREIIRWIRSQSVIEHFNGQGASAKANLEKFYFSYAMTALDNSIVQNWLKLKIDGEGKLKSIDDANLKLLWSWLYGDKSKGEPPVIQESRQIHLLNKVIEKPEAINLLKNSRNLNAAFDATKEPLSLMLEQVSSAVIGIKSVNGILNELSKPLTAKQFKSDNALQDLTEMKSLLERLNISVGNALQSF